MSQCPVPAEPLLPELAHLHVDHDWTEDEVAEFRRQWDELMTTSSAPLATWLPQGFTEG